MRHGRQKARQQRPRRRFGQGIRNQVHGDIGQGQHQHRKGIFGTVADDFGKGSRRHRGPETAAAAAVQGAVQGEMCMWMKMRDQF